MAQRSVQRYMMGKMTVILSLAVGGFFIGIGWLFYSAGTAEEGWISATGTVIEIEKHSGSGSSTTYSPVVEFRVDGDSYTVGSSISSSAKPTVGEEREIYYNPTDPNDAVIKNSTGSTAVFFICILVGLLIIVSLPIGVFRTRKRTKEIERLKSQGTQHQGIVTDVNYKGKANGKKISKVIVAADIHGTVKEFVSDSVVGAQSIVLEDLENNPIAVDVFIDPNDPEKYYVDIDDIRGVSGQRIQELIQKAKQS